MINSYAHFTPGVPILPPQTLSYNSALLDGQVETIRVFPNAKYKKSDSKKSEIFKHPTFRVFPNGKYEKSDLKKPKIFKFPCFLLSLSW